MDGRSRSCERRSPPEPPPVHRAVRDGRCRIGRSWVRRPPGAPRRYRAAPDHHARRTGAARRWPDPAPRAHLPGRPPAVSSAAWTGAGRERSRADATRAREGACSWRGRAGGRSSTGTGSPGRHHRGGISGCRAAGARTDRVVSRRVDTRMGAGRERGGAARLDGRRADGRNRGHRCGCGLDQVGRQRRRTDRARTEGAARRSARGHNHRRHHRLPRRERRRGPPRARHRGTVGLPGRALRLDPRGPGTGLGPARGARAPGRVGGVRQHRSRPGRPDAHRHDSAHARRGIGRARPAQHGQWLVRPGATRLQSGLHQGIHLPVGGFPAKAARGGRRRGDRWHADAGEPVSRISRGPSSADRPSDR